MRLHLKSFTLTITAIWTIWILIISIWSRISSNFGLEFMVMYHSVHPHPFLITRGDLSITQHIYGILFDLFYAIVDAIIFGISFSIIYNYFIEKFENIQSNM